MIQRPAGWLHHRWALACLAGLAVAFAFSLVTVAVHVGWSHVDAGAFAAIGVALATLALATMTYQLAQQTRRMADDARSEITATERLVIESQRQAEIGQKQLEISTKAMEAATRPWLSVAPFRPPLSERLIPDRAGLTSSPAHIEFKAEISRMSVTLELRNVGNGLLLIAQDGIKLIPATAPDATFHRTGYCQPAVVPSGEYVRILFEIVTHANKGTCLESPAALIGRSHGGYGTLTVVIVYTDAVGGQRTRADLKLASMNNGDPSSAEELLYVYEIDYYRDDGNDAEIVAKFLTPWYEPPQGS